MTMKHQDIADTCLMKQRGAVLALFGISLATMLGVAALSVDIGYAYQYQKKLQMTVDAAALVAVKEVQLATPQPFLRAQEMFAANMMRPSDIQSVECGSFNPNNKIFLPCDSRCSDPMRCAYCRDCRDASVNAVKVSAQSSSSAFFSPLFGISTIPVRARSVAMVTFPTSSACTRPFGIDGSSTGVLSGLAVGDVFTISSSSPGNWGKLEFQDATFPNSNDWDDAMMAGVCDARYAVNNSVPVITGNAGNPGAVLQQMQAAGLTNYMVFPLASGFFNGNKPVTIASFIVATLLDVQSINGRNFSARFRLDAVNIVPARSGGSGQASNRYLTE